jgi:hypothetical protein
VARKHLAHVSAVSSNARVVSMGIVLAVVSVQNIDTYTIFGIFIDFVNPFACTNGIRALFTVQDRRSLVLQDLSIRVNTHYKDISQGFSLPDCIIVAGMDKIKTSININPNWFSLGFHQIIFLWDRNFLVENLIDKLNDIMNLVIF